MLQLSRFPIAYKILSVVMLSSAAAAAIAITGILSLGKMRDAAERMSRSAELSVNAIRLNTPILAIGSAQFRALYDASATAREEALKAIGEETDLFRKRSGAVLEGSTGDLKAAVEDVRGRFDTFAATAGRLVNAAERVATSGSADEKAALAVDAAANAKLQRDLRLANRDVLSAFSKMVEQDNANAAAIYEQASRLLLVVGTAGILFGLCLGAAIGHFGIAAPTRRIVAVLQRLASGDYGAETMEQNRRDEVGEAARAAEALRVSLIVAREREGEIEAGKAVREAQRRDAMLDLAASFEKAVVGIVHTVTSAASEMQATAAQLSTSASSTTEQATAVSAAAEQAGSNVTSVASSAEELGASVGEIERQVETSASRSSAAVAETVTTAQTMRDLEAAAGRIGAIVDLISEIAAQTNLLALNATIEAARAGDAGRGFAVVAAEVKGLAEQTAKATADIGRQVHEIQSTTSKAASSIDDITKTIKAMDETTAAISNAVRQQSSATAEIVHRVDQASDGAREVSRNIVAVARSAAETGDAANHMLGASRELASQAVTLQRQVDLFLTNVRAA